MTTRCAMCQKRTSNGGKGDARQRAHLALRIALNLHVSRAVHVSVCKLILSRRLIFLFAAHRPPLISRLHRTTAALPRTRRNARQAALYHHSHTLPSRDAATST